VRKDRFEVGLQARTAALLAGSRQTVRFPANGTPSTFLPESDGRYMNLIT